MEGQNASGGGAPRLTEASYRFPRPMLKVRGASASIRPRSPAPTACSSRDAPAADYPLPLVDGRYGESSWLTRQ